MPDGLRMADVLIKTIVSSKVMTDRFAFLNAVGLGGFHEYTAIIRFESGNSSSQLQNKHIQRLTDSEYFESNESSPKHLTVCSKVKEFVMIFRLNVDNSC